MKRKPKIFNGGWTKMQAELKNLYDENTLLREMLRECAETIQDSADKHRSTGTPDGDKKAHTNRDMVLRIEQVLKGGQ